MRRNTNSTYFLWWRMFIFETMFAWCVQMPINYLNSKYGPLVGQRQNNQILIKLLVQLITHTCFDVGVSYFAHGLSNGCMRQLWFRTIDMTFDSKNIINYLQSVYMPITPTFL